MGKRVIVGLSYVLIVILIIIIIVSLLIYKSNLGFAIIARGYKKYGNEYCSKPINATYYEDKEHSSLASQVIITYTCELCHKDYQHFNGNRPKICPSCSDITGRCWYCGKLFKENTENI
jgi:hypothetical protein